MNVYAELGVEPIINAAGTLTRLSGSLMPPEVTDAMAAASRSFVDMEELHIAAGSRIAELVAVEAAHVCASASAGISLMAAACMAGSDRKRIRRLPNTEGMIHKFVVQSAHRNPFDQALRLAGGEFLEIAADADELGSVLHEGDIAAIYYTLAWFCTGEALPLAKVAGMGHDAGVPTIVDAAAEVPPMEHLARFVNAGADLVTFSGGKAIRGPQSSGLILGQQDLVEACRLNDCPNMGVGRTMKTGKEDIVGLVKAVELYVAKDHAVEMAVWERRVAHVLGALTGLPCVRTCRQFPYGEGQQIPHAAVSWDEEALGIGYEEVARKLRAGKPRIAVQVISRRRYGSTAPGGGELRVHPHTLREGEEMVVAQRLRELLAGG